MAIHMAAAGFLATPELVLEKPEADMLAVPLAKIADDMGFTPDPRIMNAIALLGAAGIIYGPRYVNIRDRLKKEAGEKRTKAREEAGERVVVPFPDQGQREAPPIPPSGPGVQGVGEIRPLSPEFDAANAFRFAPTEGN